MWILKTDINGNLLWQKCLGGTDNEEGVSGMEVNGGYVIAGHSGSSDGDATFNNGWSDFWLLKIDSFGNLLWQKSYGGDDIEKIYGLASGINGEIIVVGSTSSENTGDVTGFHGSINSDVWVVKCDSVGNLKWQRCLGGTAPEEYSQIGTDINGNIYIVSSTISNDGDVNCNINGNDIWLAKLDTASNVLWNKCYGGTEMDYIYDFKISNDKILLTGRSESSDGDLSQNYGYTDAWILAIDTSGNIIFSKSYGGSLTDAFHSIVLTNNNIVAAGMTMSSDHDVTMNFPGFNNIDAWIVVTDLTGNLLWQNTYGGSGQDEIQSIVSINNNKILFAGNTNTPNDGDIVDFHGNTFAQLWIGKLDSITTNTYLLSSTSVAHVFPMPFIERINVSLSNSEEIKHVEIFNIEGISISTSKEILFDKAIISLNENAKPGIYIIKVITKKNIYFYRAIRS